MLKKLIFKLEKKIKAPKSKKKSEKKLNDNNIKYE